MAKDEQLGGEVDRIVAEASRQREDSRKAPECPDCGERNLFADQPCISTQCRHARRLAKAGVEPWKYAQKFGVPLGKFDSYKEAKLPEGMEDDGRHDFFIHGPNGTGKTHTMAAMAHRVAWRTLQALATNEPPGDEWHKGLRWIYAPSLFVEIRASFGKRAKSDEAAVVRQFVNYETLFLDDLFSESITDFTLAVTCNILAQREQANRRTIITSNYDLDEVREQCPRIGSLLSGYTPYEIDGADRRESRG